MAFAAKSQNKDFIFLGGEVDSIKKKIISNQFIIIYVFKKKIHRYGDIYIRKISY